MVLASHCAMAHSSTNGLALASAGPSGDMLNEYTPKSGKAKRIPRPMNSFMCFGKAHRKQIQTDHPDLDNKGVSKLLGQKWASLSMDERQIYVDQASKLAEEHRKLYPGWKFTRDTNKKRKKSTLPGSSQGFQVNSIATTQPNSPKQVKLQSSITPSAPPTFQQAVCMPTLNTSEWHNVRDQRQFQINIQVQSLQIQQLQQLYGANFPYSQSHAPPAMVPKQEYQLYAPPTRIPIPTTETAMSSPPPPPPPPPESETEAAVSPPVATSAYAPPAYDPPPDFSVAHRIQSPPPDFEHAQRIK